MDYIFGYGSLINSSSRDKTGNTGRVFPVTVSGFQRGWIFPIPEQATTVLGVTKKSNAKCNGVLVEISETELKKFDEREEGYLRIMIKPNTISGYKPNGKTWIYINQNIKRPTKKKPLIQSYIDVVLAGCLQFNQAYAISFVNTTSFWSNHWVDDRKQPIYSRAMEYDQKIFDKIDHILKQIAPKQFAKRTII